MTAYLKAMVLKFFVDNRDMGFLDGTEVDYGREGLNEAFRFHNPNATAECGCGESFFSLTVPWVGGLGWFLSPERSFLSGLWFVAGVPLKPSLVLPSSPCVDTICADFY